MSSYEDYCKKYAGYIDGDINSDKYNNYLIDPFPNQIWKDKTKEIEKLQKQNEIMREALKQYRKVNTYRLNAYDFIEWDICCGLADTALKECEDMK